MKKMSRVILTSVAVLALLWLPACKTNRKKVDPAPQPQPEMTDTAPPVVADPPRNETPVEPERSPEEGYHLTEDLADRAVAWIRQQKALTPETPFFVYFAPGATHAPHHVPPGWADRYAGKFDDGWDALRQRTFARQQQLGVIPPEAELTPRHAEIPAWDDMPEDLKPVLARQMEVYAGFLEHVDTNVGRAPRGSLPGVGDTGRRAHEDEPLDEVGPVQRQLQRQPPAHRVTHVGGATPEVTECCGGAHEVEPVGNIGQCAFDRTRKRRLDDRPGFGALCEPVDEHDAHAQMIAS